METKLDNLEESLESLDKNLERIRFYLESDPKTKRQGLVEKIDELEKTISALLTREKIYKSQAAMAGGIGAFIVMSAWKLIAFFIK